MAVLVFLLILALVTTGSVEGASYCVCRTDVSDSAAQKTLDYACGSGADCSPIITNGVCYNPNSVKAHCSYAANSYYQKKVATGATCDFSGTAVLTTTDPSSGTCIYPSSASTAGGTSTPTTATPTTSTPNTSTPTTSTPTTGTPTTTTPTTFSPTGGIIGVNPGLGLGPSGLGNSNDLNAGFPKLCLSSSLLWFSGLVHWALLRV